MTQLRGRDQPPFIIGAPVSDGDIDGLCQRVRRLAGDGSAHALVCDASNLDPGPRVVEALVRLDEVAIEVGASLTIVDASRQLARLLTAAGRQRLLAEGGNAGGGR